MKIQTKITTQKNLGCRSLSFLMFLQELIKGQKLSVFFCKRWRNDIKCGDRSTENNVKTQILCMHFDNDNACKFAFLALI